MNRMEMFLELKKDPSKVFKGLGLIYTAKEINGTQTIVFREKYSFDEGWAVVEDICLGDITEYTEVVKPLWEVINYDDLYWYIDFNVDKGVNHSIFSYNPNDTSNAKFYNMFRTEEEAAAKAKELLEVLKK